MRLYSIIFKIFSICSSNVIGVINLVTSIESVILNASIHNIFTRLRFINKKVQTLMYVHQ